MALYITIIGLILGFFLLVKGAEEMVRTAIQIAMKFNMPNSVIGATFIGFGTSAPELFASSGAALNGNLSLGIGNIIGSNIANSLVAISVLYLALNRDFKKKLNLNNTSSIWMVFATILFVSFYLMLKEFPLFLGIGLLVLVIFVTYKLVTEEAVDQEDLLIEEKDYVGLRAVASLTATIFGSTLVVNNAVNLAEYFNISSIIIGVTVVALGTSLPEVAGTIAAAKMKNPDIVFGNIFGSNLFNIALVGGVSVSIAPGVIETDVTAEMIIMLVASLIVILLSKSTVKKSYLIGLTALISYSVFIYTLF
jgi:cation:H+ antiporter|tara:strand:- start:2577 stop:3500 length:924 start_codon:yes stop_codon:yes gene_type:complete